MFSIDNLTKSYGGHTLFDGVSFKISSRERVGLVARNGHGKTTLFRMLIGETDYDTGTISAPKNYRIGHVAQHLDFRASTILDEGIRGLPPADQHQHWKVEKILFGLGFSQVDLYRSPHEFSGGYQVRLNLAKVLVSEPDLLLLDEPTNYLDITSIRWIERFLLQWPREIMLITHDRGFMDRIVTHVVGLHRGKARKIQGDTGKYYTQIAQDEEIYEKTRLNDERREKEIRLFISRFRAKARLANMVQSRIKTLAKMEKKEKLIQLKNLDFSFRSKAHRSKHILTASGLSFGYEKEIPLIQDFDLTISTGDRVCVVGKNGMGKTTLLKLLAGVLHPTAGGVTYHPAVERGFYEQTNVQSLVESRTIEEEMLAAHTDVDRQMARNICGAMMFEGDAALKKIAVISGGEKARVMLGKLLAKPYNLLLLDEPTNHLDMEACDALLAAIDNFDGTVVMVTHNEMFLHALATRLVVLRGTGIEVVEGSYQHFLDQGGWEDAPPPESGALSARGKGTRSDQAPRRTKKEARRLRSEILTQRAKVLKPMESGIAAAERDIEAQEERLEQLNDDMLTAAETQDGERIADLSRQIHLCQSRIEERFEELEGLYDQKEAHERRFDKQLREFQ
ncbi:MAG: ATP-binding cassette domain-containing protein [Desulfosarcinaceae bacterium]|nr:ATP-binding cassette domain-containing protein [Desulfosarcinaceae bacterium]